MKPQFIEVGLAEKQGQEMEKFFRTIEYRLSRYQDINQAIEEINGLTSLCCLIVNVDVDQVTYQQILTACSKIRNDENIFIYFASQSNDPEERVRWLSYGATSYINMPFKPEELFRRVETIANLRTKNLLQEENLQIDLVNHTVKYNHHLIDISPSAYEVLVYFVSNANEVITRKQILNEVFDKQSDICERSIDTWVKYIRKHTSKDLIETIFGVGYRFNAKSQR